MLSNRFRSSNRFKGKIGALQFVFRGEDPPAESNTIKEMRANLEKAQNEAKTLKEQLGNVTNELSTIKKGQMTEIEKLKTENGELLTQIEGFKSSVTKLDSLTAQNKTAMDFIANQFTEAIAKLPEEHREKAKLIAFIENDPISSLSKLTQLSELIIVPTSQGNPTNPPTPKPNEKKTHTDLKNSSWSDALTPVPAKRAV